MCNRKFTYTRYALILVLQFLFIASPSVAQKTQNRADTFKLLSGIVGTWKMDKGSAALYEVWTRQSDSLLIGQSFKVAGSDTTVLETIRLFLLNKNIIYAPIAFGQNNEEVVEFIFIKKKNRQFIFENKKHDFPQRIVYELTPADSLHAWIEGEIKGEMRRIDYNYIKINNSK